MTDDPRYIEYDTLDFIEADEATREAMKDEFRPTEGPECAAMHIIVPGEKEMLLTRPKWPENSF